MSITKIFSDWYRLEIWRNERNIYSFLCKHDIKQQHWRSSRFRLVKLTRLNQFSHVRWYNKKKKQVAVKKIGRKYFLTKCSFLSIWNSAGSLNGIASFLSMYQQIWASLGFCCIWWLSCNHFFMERSKGFCWQAHKGASPPPQVLVSLCNKDRIQVADMQMTPCHSTDKPIIW